MFAHFVSHAREIEKCEMEKRDQRAVFPVGAETVTLLLLSSVWTELVRSRRSTTSKLCHPIPERQSKAKLRTEDGPHQRLLRRSRARGTAFQARTKLGQARSELLSAEDSSSPDRRETYFLVRAIDRGLEASTPQELSSRMRSDTRQTRAAVFHKQAQALAFPFLSLKEEVYKVLLTRQASCPPPPFFTFSFSASCSATPATAPC